LEDLRQRPVVHDTIACPLGMTEYIAHRGAHDVCIENTLDAFRRAVDLGFSGVELDVHATADGVCVVHHDETVVTQKVALSIRGTSFDTLRDSAPLVPRLDEVLSLLTGRTCVYVEIKGVGIERQVTDVIAASHAECAVHAFDHRVVRRVKELLPSLRTGILESGRLVNSAAALREAGATDLWQWHEFIDESLVREVADGGGRVIAWTANTSSEWRVLQDFGVGGICTDLSLPASERSTRTIDIDR